MESMAALRLMVLVKALKYQKLCGISIARAQGIMDEGLALNDMHKYRELCYETEKAKLYNEFSDELRELALRMDVLCAFRCRQMEEALKCSRKWTERESGRSPADLFGKIHADFPGL